MLSRLSISVHSLSGTLELLRFQMLGGLIISIHSKVLAIQESPPNLSNNIAIIGGDANEYLPIILGLENNATLTMYQDLSSFNDSQFAKRFDYIYFLGYKAHLERATNVRALLPLLQRTSILVFSSDVPCSAKREISFWPSYWLTIFEDLGCKVSLDLRRDLWFDTRIPARILESILLVHSETNEI